MEEDGPVWLELHGGSAPVWCDMSRGGWTLGFLRNSASYASQPDFGSGEQQVGVLALSPQVASVLTEGILGWLDLNAFDYTELRLAGYTDGVETALTANIPRSELRIAFGQPGYLLYGPDHYWCGGPASYTDAGVGAVNNPQGALADCKGHGSLGSGWDFSASPYANRGLSLCGGDAYAAMQATIGGGWFYYGSAGASQAIWVR